MSSEGADSSTLRLARTALAVAVVVNLVLLYWPRTAGPAGVPGLDKVVHVATFASVAWTGLRAGLGARWLLPLLVAHAAMSEVVQGVFLPHRSGDVLDAVADTVGVLLGTALHPPRRSLPRVLSRKASWGGDPAGADRDAGGPTAGGDPGAG